MSDAPVPEVDRLDPVPSGPFILSTGLELNVVPLQTRQLFRLMRILTHGAGAALLSSALDFSAQPEEFVGKLLAVTVLSIPDAENETIEFVASMVEPAKLVKKDVAKQSDAEKAANQALWDQVNTDLYNPDPMDLLEIVERVVRAEAPELQALGKKIGRFLELAKKTGALKGGKDASPLTSPETLSQASSVPSASPLTPSVPSMVGQTSESLIFRSEGSVKSVPPSVPVGVPDPTNVAH
jgi:hypothetical protein